MNRRHTPTDVDDALGRDPIARVACACVEKHRTSNLRQRHVDTSQHPWKKQCESELGRGESFESVVCGSRKTLVVVRVRASVRERSGVCVCYGERDSVVRKRTTPARFSVTNVRKTRLPA